MFNKIISKLMAGHAFFCHKEQLEFEMALEMRKEKILNQALFSF